MAGSDIAYDCQTCAAVQGRLTLTNVPRIFEGAYWIVEHAHPTAIRGWIVLALRRHCRAIHELSDAEFLELSRLLALVTRGLYSATNCSKEYLMQFAEAAGHDHVHFHVVARSVEWPDEWKGPKVFAGLGDSVDSPLGPDDLEPVARELRRTIRNGFAASHSFV